MRNYSKNAKGNYPVKRAFADIGESEAGN